VLPHMPPSSLIFMMPSVHPLYRSGRAWETSHNPSAFSPYHIVFFDLLSLRCKCG
jgi:hypothetical protein